MLNTSRIMMLNNEFMSNGTTLFTRVLTVVYAASSEAPVPPKSPVNGPPSKSPPPNGESKRETVLYPLAN